MTVDLYFGVMNNGDENRMEDRIASSVMMINGFLQKYRKYKNPEESKSPFSANLLTILFQLKLYKGVKNRKFIPMHQFIKTDALWHLLYSE